MWLESACRIKIVGKGSHRQLLLNRESQITVSSIALLPGLDNEYKPPLPAKRAPAAAAAAGAPAIPQEPDDGDDSSDEDFLPPLESDSDDECDSNGDKDDEYEIEDLASDDGDENAAVVGINLARVRFSDAKRDTRRRIVKEAAGAMQVAVSGMLHKNGQSDVNAVIAAAAASIERREAKLKDREDEMRALARSPVVQGMAKAYAEAPKRDKVQLLSALAQHFTLPALNAYVFNDLDVTVTYFLLGRAREHAETIGPGCVRPAQDKFVRSRLDDGELEFAYAFIMQHVSGHAYGTRTATLDRAGASVQLPKTTASKSTDELTAMYRDAVAAHPDYEGICPTHLVFVIDALVGGDEKSLAALDNVYKKCLLDNGERAQRLINVVTVGRLDLADRLKDDLQRNEVFLRKQYPAELTDDKGCLFRGVSYPHAFGEGDETGRAVENELFCDGVIRLDIWQQDVHLAINTMLHPLPAGHPDTPASLHDYVENNIIVDYRTYLAHVVRKTHEASVKQKILSSEAFGEDCVLLIVDWKMKVLARVFRESMVEFFGKRGFSIHGAQFIWRKTADEMAADAASSTKFFSTMHTAFVDLVSDDGKEDAFAAATMVQVALKTFKAQNPHITKAIVATDGAGCYACTEFAVFLGHCGKLTDIRVTAHSVSEAGGGKTSQDGHFAFINLQIDDAVVAGRGNMDVRSAAECARALVRGGGLPSTSTASIVLVRGAAEDDGDNDSLKGLKQNLYRIYVYATAEVEAVATELLGFRQSFRGDEPPHLAVTMPELLELCDAPTSSTAVVTWPATAADAVAAAALPAVQLTLSEADRTQRKKIRGRGKRARNNAAGQREDEQEMQLEYDEEASKRPHVYQEAKRRLRGRSDHDRITEGAVVALAGVTQAFSSSSAPRELHLDYRTYDSAVAEFKLFDGTSAVINLPPFAFAQKSSSTNARVTVAQLKHAVWAQGIGDKSVHPNGSKMFPEQMATSMRLRGTAAGQVRTEN